MLITLPPRRLPISGRICGLPVTNIRVPGDCWRSWPSESRSLTWCSVAHSSRASMHMNERFLTEVTCSIFKISEICSPCPPMEFFRFLYAFDISSGISSSPKTSCFRKEPSTPAGDCSLWDAKSK